MSVWDSIIVIIVIEDIWDSISIIIYITILLLIIKLLLLLLVRLLSLLALLQLHQQISVAESVLEQSRISRDHWQSRIALLRSNNLDRDLLGERARHVAGLVNDGEFVVLGETATPIP